MLDLRGSWSSTLQVVNFLAITENLPARQAHLGVQLRDNGLGLGVFQEDQKFHVVVKLLRNDLSHGAAGQAEGSCLWRGSHHGWGESCHKYAWLNVNVTYCRVFILIIHLESES